MLLVGGYGSNTLTGGTMIFGNFIPGDRIAEAKAHFADTSGYDGAGQGLINSLIDAAIAPVDPAGIIGATITGSRGGLMFGGPGNNSFFATGAGAYEMVGGSWVNSFSIATSFAGGPATYQIDGGPFGQSSLVVRVPFNDIVTFENASVPDLYHPEFKALAVLGQAGLSATAHGIQTVKVIASPGSIVEFGDTSEVNAQFSIEGAAHLKFSGTAQPDVFDLDVTGIYFAKKNHFTIGDLFTGPPNSSVLLHENPLVPGVGSTTIPDLYDGFIPLVYLPPRWADPVYTVKRLYGTNGRMQSIAFSVSDADASSITLDGKGAADTYNVEQGVGGFLDVTIDDADTTTQNTAAVRLRESDVVYTSATLTDNSLALGFYTMPSTRTNIATKLPLQYPQFYNLSGYLDWTNSVYYSPTIFFGANVDVGLEFAVKFQEFIIDRPTALQNVNVGFGVDPIARNRTLPDGFAGAPGGVGINLELPLWVYDPDGPSSDIVYLGPAPVTTTLRALSQKPLLDIQHNAGNLSVDLQFWRVTENSVFGLGLVHNMGLNVNIDSNSGMLSFHNLPIFGSGIPSAPNVSTFNVFENSGTLNFDFPELPILGTVVNVLGNAGTINVVNGVGTGTPGVQMNFGDNGNAANIHGAVNLSGIRSVFNVVFDDRNNIAGGRLWTVDSTQVSVGDLTAFFLRPGTGLVGRLEVRPNSGSTVVVNAVPSGVSSPINLFGTGTGNTLTGPLLAGGTTWRVDGPGSGSMQVTAFQQLVWQNMQTLVGSSGNDTFEIKPGGSITGALNGGGGFNTLFYNPPPTPFVVDLANGIASLVNGTVSNIQAVVPDPPPFLVGDYNLNGRVDAADYTVWRNALGQSGLAPFSGADGDGDGEITQADYNVWRSHFGEVLPPPGAGSVTIADVAMEQLPTLNSGAAALAFVEPAFQIGGAIEQTPAELTSPPVEPEVEKTRTAALAILDNRFAPHDWVSRPIARINLFRVAQLVPNDLLLLLANDRVGRPSWRDFSAANDRKDDDRRDDGLDSQSLSDETLAVALAEWR